MLTPEVEIRERRGGVRIQVNLPARYQSGTTNLVGWVGNLSRNGIFLRSQYLDERGAQVEVTFSLPGDRQQLAVSGTVVRLNETPLSPGMAIRFTQLPDVARRKLADFMSRRHRTLPNR